VLAPVRSQSALDPWEPSYVLSPRAGPRAHAWTPTPRSEGAPPSGGAPSFFSSFNRHFHEAGGRWVVVKVCEDHSVDGVVAVKVCEDHSVDGVMAVTSKSGDTRQPLNRGAPRQPLNRVALRQPLK
jgi:hypothetical protein